MELPQLRIALLGALLVTACSKAPKCPDGISSCSSVFYSGLEDSKCFRIPSIIKTQKGTLLAFAENRITGCSDNNEHHIVLRRSKDDGKTWGALITVVKAKDPPCKGCPKALSNPNPVEVTLKNGSKAILLHYDTLNNPDSSHHGVDMQKVRSCQQFRPLPA
jgi:sialidase-1